VNDEGMRNPVFDIMKGVAILLMFVGHMAIPADGFLNRFIYSFHMPLFFLLAGYFAKSCEEAQVSNTKMLINDCKRLLVPYIITSAAILLFTLMRVLIKHDVSILMDKFYHILYRFDIIPIWFLIALLWIRVLFRPMMRLGRWALPVSIIISGAAIFFVHHYTQLPFCILTALSSLVFYAIGWWHKRYGFPRWLIVCAVVCWIGVMMGSRIDLYNVAYGIYPLTLLGASGATYAIYKIASFVHQRWEKSVILSALRWVGFNSLILICFHAFDIYCCYVTMVLDGMFGIELSYWPIQIIRDVLVFMLSWLYVTFVRPIVKR